MGLREMRASARKGLLVPVAAGLLATVAIGASTGSAAESSSVRVEVLATNQSSILAAGKLRASVGAKVPGTVKVVPRAQLTGGPPARIGKARRVRFDEPGTRVLRLRLSSAGRALIGDCRPKNLVVSARLKTNGAQAAATTRALATVPLVIDGSSCAAAPGTPATRAAPARRWRRRRRWRWRWWRLRPQLQRDPPADPYTGPPIDATNARRCDFLVLGRLPAAVPERLLHRGRRLDRHRAPAQPEHPVDAANQAGKPIDPAEHNLNDGFSPGNTMIAKVPGLDSLQAFDNTGPSRSTTWAPTTTRTSRWS